MDSDIDYRMERPPSISGEIMIAEDVLILCAEKGAQRYAERHPRPAHVNAVQAAEMLDLTAQTVRKMVRDGRLALNNLGMIPISEIDRALLIK